ncbi:TetR/AcrR family transcriptional regulator [Homoserinimonas sp. A520]
MKSSVNGENEPKLSRKERAGRTRARILSAAREEFTASGYHATTMVVIAARADVAVQTVYFVFGTKAQLLNDLLGVSVMGQSETGTPIARPEDSDWFRDALESGDGATAIAHFVRGTVPIYARAAAVAETARVAARTDPDVAEVYEESERHRSREFRKVTESLGAHGLLQPGLTAARAGDILVTLLGPQNYLAFTAQHEWTDAEFADWVTDALARLLLPPVD